jgi:hypothetical protein
MNKRFDDSWSYDEKWVKLRYILRNCLQKIYSFDKWHIQPPCEKKYVRYIRKYIEEMGENGTYVEIGCGLGDIIGDLKVNGDKYGYDISKEAVRCASMLHKRTHFIIGSCDNVKLGKIKCLIMVNWIQDESDDNVKQWIRMLKTNNNIECFIVDKFVMTTESYRYLHDWQMILGEEYKLKSRSKGFAAAQNNRRFIEVWSKD